MLDLTIRGLNIRIYFGFFAAVMFYFYISGNDTLGIAAALTSCLLHELGHLSAMLLFGCPPERLTAGGFKLTRSFDKQCGRAAEAVILSAGCAVNLLLAAVSALTGYETLTVTNLALCAANLLPFSSLDGGRILALFGTQVRKTTAAMAGILLTAAVILTGQSPAALLMIAFAAAAEFLF